jgi:hypothetical protein
VKYIKSQPWLVAFAPIDLKDATVRLLDGFSNLTYSPTVGAAGALLGATSVPLTEGTMGITVPVGAHVKFAGDTTKYVVTARTFNAAGENEVQTLSASGASSGTFDIDITLPGNDPVTVAGLAFDAAPAAIQTAVNLALAGLAVNGVTYTAGDVAVTGAGTADLNSTVFTFSGASVDKLPIAAMTVDGSGLSGGGSEAFTETNGGVEAGATDSVTISPVLAVALVGGEAVTFLPIELDIKLGEGNFTYDESRPITYILNRGLLDTYKEGDQTPMDVAFDFTWEFITAIAGAATPTVEQVLKRKGPASTWTSSNTADPCAPYCVDVEIVNAPNCAGILAEVIRLPTFNYESLSHDSSAASVSVAGKCNAIDAIITRTDNF